MTASLRIALLTYATKPRGSVMQTLYLAEALHQLGHQVCVFALSKDGSGFSRPLSCATRLIPSQAMSADDVEALVKQRIQEFVDYFEQSTEIFDCYHAQDCITANALAILRNRQHIPHFVRTIHHIDDYNHPYLQQCQDRSIYAPDLCLCVSEYWQVQIQQQYQVKAARVINGVDTKRFSAISSPSDQELKQRLGLTGNPIFLTVGGIEPRKNSITLLTAFALTLPYYPQAQLVIAGGDTFFDYSPYRQEFFSMVEQLGVPLSALVFPGIVSDRELPMLYRCADAFVFPSVKEGWGLVVMEAIAAGLPIVTSKIPPFTEFLTEEEALLVDPELPMAIAAALCQVTQPQTTKLLVQNSQAVLAEYTWEKAAQMHLNLYTQLLTPIFLSPSF